MFISLNNLVSSRRTASSVAISRMALRRERIEEVVVASADPRPDSQEMYPFRPYLGEAGAEADAAGEEVAAQVGRYATRRPRGVKNKLQPLLGYLLRRNVPNGDWLSGLAVGDDVEVRVEKWVLGVVTGKRCEGGLVRSVKVMRLPMRSDSRSDCRRDPAEFDGGRWFCVEDGLLGPLGSRVEHEDAQWSRVQWQEQQEAQMQEDAGEKPDPEDHDPAAGAGAGAWIVLKPRLSKDKRPASKSNPNPNPNPNPNRPVSKSVKQDAQHAQPSAAEDAPEASVRVRVRVTTNPNPAPEASAASRSHAKSNSRIAKRKKNCSGKGVGKSSKRPCMRAGSAGSAEHESESSGEDEEPSGAMDPAGESRTDPGALLVPTASPASPHEPVPDAGSLWPSYEMCMEQAAADYQKLLQQRRQDKQQQPQPMLFGLEGPDEDNDKGVHVLMPTSSGPAPAPAPKPADAAERPESEPNCYEKWPGLIVG